MEFCFSRAGRSAVAKSTFALVLASPAGISFAALQDAQAQQQSQPAGQAGAQAQSGQAPAKKNYKDRAEYELYAKITQTQDPKQRLELLNQWEQKYPSSDYAHDRLLYYVNTLNQLAPNDPSARQQLIDKSKQLLKEDPKAYQAAYFISVWAPAVGGQNPPPEMQSTIQDAAQMVISDADQNFASAKKPQNMSDADWAKAKSDVLALAHKDLAYVANAKNDTKTAEDQYKESLKANPNQGPLSYEYAKMLQTDSKIPADQKYPTILYEYARAAQYDGPGSLSAAQRPQVLAYFNKVYAQYHGSADGADQLLSQAKNSPLPPDGFNITSAASIAQNQAQQLQSRIDGDPSFKLWYSIQQQLVQQGDQFFSQMKGAEIPGTQAGVKSFTGTVISVEPADKPTKVVLGVTDPTKPDATLDFSEPIPATAVQVGSKVDFSGIAESFSANPYMLTFRDPSIPGVKTSAPSKRGGSRRR